MCVRTCVPVCGERTEGKKDTLLYTFLPPIHPDIPEPPSCLAATLTLSSITPTTTHALCSPLSPSPLLSPHKKSRLLVDDEVATKLGTTLWLRAYLVLLWHAGVASGKHSMVRAPVWLLHMRMRTRHAGGRLATPSVPSSLYACALTNTNLHSIILKIEASTPLGAANPLTSQSRCEIP